MLHQILFAAGFGGKTGKDQQMVEKSTEGVGNVTITIRNNQISNEGKPHPQTSIRKQNDLLLHLREKYAPLHSRMHKCLVVCTFTY